MLAMAIGVGVFLKAHPFSLDVLKYLSAAVMIYLSLLTLKNQDGVSKISGSLSWRAGLIVHPLNPKAWVMTILAWTEFGPQLAPYATDCYYLFKFCFCAAGFSQPLGVSRRTIILGIWNKFMAEQTTCGCNMCCCYLDIVALNI